MSAMPGCGGRESCGLPEVCSISVLRKPGEAQSVYTGGSSLPSRCTALATRLGADSALALAAFDNGGIGATCWLPDEPVAFLSTSGGNLSEQICAIGLDYFADLDCFLGRGRQIPCFVGTNEGTVITLEFDMQSGALGFTRRWQAHPRCRTPSAGVSFAGVSALSTVGDTVISGGADGTARIWSTSMQGSMEYRCLADAHVGAVTAVAASTCELSISGSAEGGFTVSAGEDGAVRMWSPHGDTTLPCHRREESGPDGIARRCSVCALALDERYWRLLAASEDAFVRMWDVAVGKPTRRFHHPVDAAFVNLNADVLAAELSGVRSVSCDAEECPTNLASGGADGSWRLWDVRLAHPAVTCANAHAAAIASVAIRGVRILTASPDGWARLWDLRGSQEKPVECVYMLGLRPAKSGSRKRGSAAAEVAGCSAACGLGAFCR